MEKTKIKEIKKIYSLQKLNAGNSVYCGKKGKSKPFFEKIMSKLEKKNYKY